MLTKIQLECTDLLDLQETENAIHEKLEFHLKLHPEKSIVINKFIEDNLLIIKILNLGLSVN